MTTGIQLSPSGTSLVLVLGALLAGCGSMELESKPAPESFRLLYDQDFKHESSVKDFVASDPAVWSVSTGRDGGWLELEGPSAYEPPHRSPLSIALVDGPVVESFVLEADLQQTGREYGHRDLCLFFGFQDPEHYYYAHLATKADDNAHQIFIVNGAERRPITTARTFGVDWGSADWHRVRLERNVKTEHIQVYFDDSPKPVLRARDGTFGAGAVGFGSFDDVGRFADVRLWSDELEVRPPDFFGRIERAR